MGGVYVTYVADVDKGQWHVVRLVWSFKKHSLGAYYYAFFSVGWLWDLNVNEIKWYTKWFKGFDLENLKKITIDVTTHCDSSETPSQFWIPI